MGELGEGAGVEADWERGEDGHHSPQWGLSFSGSGVLQKKGSQGDGIKGSERVSPEDVEHTGREEDTGSAGVLGVLTWGD